MSKRRIAAIEQDALELTERLELGDSESVRAWFLHKYPAIAGRIVRNGDWEQFLSAVREIARMEPGQFERSMLQLLREYQHQRR